MYLLKSLSTAHHPIFHALYRFFLTLQITCLVVLFSFPLSYAYEYGATTVPVATEDFPDGQEALETLLNHATGLKEPRVYKDKAPKCFENAMQLTPSWLKSHYGKLPLSSVREESATQVQLSQYFLSQAIELMESDECQDDVSFVSILDKKMAHTLKTCNQLSSLPFQGTRQSSINLLEHESFLYPLNYEKKQVPITFAISFSLWQKMSKHDETVQETKRQLPCIYKKLQSDFDKTSLTLPNHVTFLDVSNKHHVEYLHQNMIHVSSVIIQTHGQQKVVLMPPISEQHRHHHWLDFTGQFFFNKEIDLSASESVLSCESRRAHTTLYYVDLNPGDFLLIPANWFIYRKSLSTSVSLSLNYLSGDKWRLFSFQAEPMEQEHDQHLIQEKHAVNAWAKMEMQKYPDSKYNIVHVCKKIQVVISDATQLVLDLCFSNLSSLPDAIFRIAHLKKLDLSCNKLTSFSLSSMPKLALLDVSCNQLTSVSLSHMPKLTLINLEENKLISVSLSHMPELASLHLRGNQLTSVSLSHVENLVSIDLAKNQLTSFPLSDMLKLASLDLGQNQFTSFSLSHVENLISLDLEHNRLTSFSLSHMPQLASLNLAYNELTSFFLNHVERLNSLNLKHNRLTSFPLSHVEKLASLNLKHNRLTSFSLDDAEHLTLLHLGNNQLTSFSLSHMKNLALLYLSNNQLSSFLSCDLPSVTHIDLRNNNLSYLGQDCISSINTHRHITLDLRDNPLSNEGRTHIQKNLLQRLGDSVTYYPFLHPLIEHINYNTITYKDFVALLFPHNIPPSENDCLICPITHANPSQVIALMSGNKCYKIYDADALIKWIRTQSPSEEFSEEVHNPYTREPLTLEHLISAKELCVLQYLKQELGLASTENIDTIPDHKS